VFCAGCVCLRSFVSVHLAVNWKGSPREMLTRASAVASSEVIKMHLDLRAADQHPHERSLWGIRLKMLRGAC
jgi:hypothetical protein